MVILQQDSVVYLPHAGKRRVATRRASIPFRHLSEIPRFAESRLSILE